MVRRRAQAALEYLFTYGWAFLAILLTLGSLAYFGVFDMNNLRGNSCTFPPGILCDDYTFSNELGANSSLYLNLMNTHGVDLNVTAMSMSNDITGEVTCLTNTSVPVDGILWDNEEILGFRCDVQDDVYVSGQNYEIVVDLSFTQQGNTYEYNSSGTVLVTAQ